MLQDHHIWMCPVCQQALSHVEGRFICPSSHSFDLAREGYVNLILAHQRSSQQAGDPPDSLRQRRKFLEAGHYRPLVEAVSAMVSEAGGAGQILDAGCGEGYLLRSLKSEIVADGFHGVDVSKAAVRLAARSCADISFAVANAVRLPVLAGSVDLYLVMMAPRYEQEVRRVLAPGGVLLSVTPAARHLAALRNLVYEEVHPHSPSEPSADFRLMEHQQVEFALNLTSPESVAQLVEMTPYKWHMDPATYQRLRDLTSLTDTAHFDLQLLTPA
ncbi:MAG: methyltransferase domain-containing protein [Candidatus Latescibacterota bacterium]|nr:methyltransferase domain-containing protein [Candidatus Latescibacterota bacterium]